MNILLHMLRDVDVRRLRKKQPEERKEESKGGGTEEGSIKQEIQRVNSKRILLTTTSATLANQIASSYSRLVDKASKTKELDLGDNPTID